MFYPVVGVAEDMAGTVDILEDLYPQFFLGLGMAYRKDFAGPFPMIYHSFSSQYYKALSSFSDQKTNRGFNKIPLRPETVQVLRQNLSLEYDFYYFLKNRLERQLTELRGRI